MEKRTGYIVALQLTEENIIKAAKYTDNKQALENVAACNYHFFPHRMAKDKFIQRIQKGGNHVYSVTEIEYQTFRVSDTVQKLLDTLPERTPE